MKNAAVGRLGSVVVSVHNAGAPSPGEFEALLAAIKAGPLDGILAFSTGWSPGSRERNELRQAVGKARVAVMIESSVGRAAIAVMSMFLDLKGMPLDQPKAALEFLRVPPQQHGEALAMLERLKREVGVSP